MGKIDHILIELGVLELDLKLLHYFSVWGFENYKMGKDPDLRVIWEKLPEMMITLDLVKRSVVSYLGMLLLKEQYPEFMDQIADCKDAGTDETSPQYLYVYLTRQFESLMSDIAQLVESIHTRDPTNAEATELIVGSKFMLMYIGSHPNRILPLVNFAERLGDYLQLIQGSRDTQYQLAPLLCNTVYRMFIFDDRIQECDIPILPTYEKFLLELDDPMVEVDGDDVVDAIRNAILSFNNQVYRTARYENQVPLYQILLYCTPNFFQAVYDQNLMALRLINLYSAFVLLTGCYFNRHTNIWVDFMNWYKLYNQKMFGDWYYLWDASLYRLMVEKDFVMNGCTGYAQFDPMVLDLVH